MTKVIEMTGSPKPYFSTKSKFLEALEPYGYTQDKMKKKDNKVNILVTNSPESTTNKMQLAKDLGVEIMTYEEMVEAFDLSE